MSAGDTTGRPVQGGADPDAWRLPAGRAPQGPGTRVTCSSLLHREVGASWGAPRRQAAQWFQATWPHHSFTTVVLKWAFGHIWRQFWLSQWGSQLEEAGDAVKCPTVHREAPAREQVAPDISGTMVEAPVPEVTDPVGSAPGLAQPCSFSPVPVPSPALQALHLGSPLPAPARVCRPHPACGLGALGPKHDLRRWFGGFIFTLAPPGPPEASPHLPTGPPPSPSSSPRLLF